jgi:hypothetical protein
MNCRFCGQSLRHTFVDLGMQPLANSYVDASRAEAMEKFYPLHARVCEACFLVQVPELATPEEIFSDYAYLSSVSSSWLAHYGRLADTMMDLLQLAPTDLVVEIASNDGGLLRCFKERGVTTLGIEPARNVAEIARAGGIETVAEFFGTSLATQLRAAGKSPRLLIGNNVLAHVPNINDFVRGLQTLLAPDGVLSMEFPHLMQLMELNQFDTIYHEHFSYLSLMTVAKIFEHHGLRVFDVHELPTHGGSLRVLACQASSSHRATTDRVAALIEKERAYGLSSMKTYEAFGERVHETKRKLLEFLIAAKRDGKRVVGYGAPAKGNTLLNYCGVRQDFIDFTVDRSDLKQGKLLPGTRIPVKTPDAIAQARPDYVLILPWNIEKEIVEQLSFIREWGGRFVVPIPEVRIN